MRILQVIPYFAPAWQYGGPIHVVLGLSKQLQKNGHEVTILTTTANGDMEIEWDQENPRKLEGLDVFYFKRFRPEKHLSFIPYLGQTVGYFYSPELRKFLMDNADRFDLLHLHELFCYPALAAARIALGREIPYVLHVHGMLDEYRLKQRKLKKMLYLRALGQKMLDMAGGLVAITETESRALRELNIKAPITTIPNGVDIPLVANGGHAEEEPQSGDRRGRMILYLGRIHPVKGIEILIAAFAKIASSYDALSLVIAGPDEIGYKKELIKKVEALNLNGKVKFAGLVSGRQKEALLSQAEVFALTSHSEGFSMAVLEALAYGKPVVITQGCHFDDVATHEAGLVSPSDVDRIAENLDAILRDPIRRANMGKNARRLIKDKYSWAIIAGKTETFYKEVLENP